MISLLKQIRLSSSWVNRYYGLLKVTFEWPFLFLWLPRTVIIIVYSLINIDKIMSNNDLLIIWKYDESTQD